MEYRKLGETDLTVSVITFGAWAAGGWMWGGNDRNEAINAIRAAYDCGVTSIDTAPVYGQGRSEEIVGQAIRGLPRDKIQILTKFGMRWDLSKGDFSMHSTDNEGKEIDIYRYAGKESIAKEVEDSLRRLGTDYIDLYQIHWPDTTTPIQESFEVIATLQKEGKIRYAGVCNYNAGQMREAENYVKLASNQVPFSMVNRGIEDEVLPYCLGHNKAILAYSPLERGLLTGKMKPGQEFGTGDHRASNRFFTDESIAKTNAFLDHIRPLAKSKNASLAQLVLKWTLSVPGITIALAGARDQRQARENAASVEVPLTAEEINFIDEVLRTP